MPPTNLNFLRYEKIFLCAAVLAAGMAEAQNVTVSGYVTDRTSGETLLSATVLDMQSGRGTVTNSYGHYSLTLPAGDIRLAVSYVGYETEMSEFRLSRDTVMSIQLAESTHLQEVTVIGQRNDLGVRGSQMSAIEVPVTQIKSVPTMFGETDVIKVLQLLPGVQSGTEGSAGMYVRGGGPDENLLLLDGVPVYNVNHLFGFFSVFNADAIKNVTLYKGSFPARFGGRLSSVIDIRSNDGDMYNYHGNVSVGLISAKANVEGPIWKGKTSFNVSARRTYADLLAQPILMIKDAKEDMKRNLAGYYFYDVNAKVTHRFSDRDRLFLSYYMGDDVIYTNMLTKELGGAENGVHEKTKMDWNWGNIVGALRWNHIISPKLFMDVSANATRYRYDMKLGAEMETAENGKTDRSESSVTYKSGIVDYTGKVDFEYRPASTHTLRLGTEYLFHTFKPGVQTTRYDTSEQGMQLNMDTTYGDRNVLAHEAAVYVEDDMQLGYRFKGNVGVRYSAFWVQGSFYNSVQPRASLRVLLTEDLSAKAGYAYMTQYVHMLSNNNLSLPSDLWVPVTARIRPMHSHQVSLGLFYQLKNWADFSVEGYYKTMDNLIEYKDGATFFGAATGWEDKVCMGRGWSYGVEFLLQRTFGNTTGWLGYTWSKSERLFNRPGEELNFGRKFPAKYDRRHDISLTVAHKFNDRIDIAGTWVFSSGNCGTLGTQSYYAPPVPGMEYPAEGEITYISERNNYRLPAYHRLDLGVNFHKQKKHGVRTWNISIYNAYCQMNPFLVYESTTTDAAGNVQNKLMKLTLFPIIPSVSYSFKF